MGLNSSRSSLPQSRSAKKERRKEGGGGGGNKVDSDGSTPDNQMMIFDHSRRGY